MYTRRDYLRQYCSHDQYYFQFITDDIIAVVERRLGLDTILDSMEPNFDDIPLRKWDDLVFYIKNFVNPQTIVETQEGWLPYTGVNIAKQAAKMIRERETNMELV